MFPPGFHDTRAPNVISHNTNRCSQSGITSIEKKVSCYGKLRHWFDEFEPEAEKYVKNSFEKLERKGKRPSPPLKETVTWPKKLISVI